MVWSSCISKYEYNFLNQTIGGGGKHCTSYVLTVSQILGIKHFSRRKVEHLILKSDLQHASLHIGKGFLLSMCTSIDLSKKEPCSDSPFSPLYSYNSFLYLLIVTVSLSSEIKTVTTEIAPMCNLHCCFQSSFEM